MPAEILMPKKGILIPGVHGPQIELDFVDYVYSIILKL